jgi:dienelactone hydrolase
MMNATSMSLAGDAEAAVTYLLSRPEIDRKMIGLAGHSEGGLIAPIVASRNSNVAFIVSLAGPGVSGYDILIRQTRDIQTASGIPEKDIEETIKTNGRLFEMVMAEADQRKLAKTAMEWYNKELDGQGITPEERKTKMAQFTQGLLSVNSPWFRYFLAAEPAEYWSKVKVPVLALNGDKDLQVSAAVNLPAIKTSLKKAKNRKVTIKAIPGLNHLFQQCNTGSPSEYASIEETFSPEALQIITDWIKLTGNKKK